MIRPLGTGIVVLLPALCLAAGPAETKSNPAAAAADGSAAHSPHDMQWLKRFFGSAGKAEPDRSTASRRSEPAAAPDAPDFSNAPFPLVRVRGVEAESEWRRLQALWRKEGASAVVLGDATEAAQVFEAGTHEERSPAEILAAAGQISVSAYFAERVKETTEDGAEPDPGPWPARTPPAIELGAHLDVVSGEPKPAVYIARIPTPRPWEIPALLKVGGWNDCPDAPTHTAVFQHWARTYGLEIYAVTGDVIECTVARPPSTREAALTLAREQFLFCTDIVYQGTGNIAALAATLKDSRAWYFWWD